MTMQSIKLHKSLKYILPYKTKDLVRLGNKSDSGYVISRKALRKVNFLISFGMSNNWTFEENFLKLSSKNKIHIYDHTVGYKFFLINFIRSIKRMFYFKSNFENIFNKLKDLIGYYYIKNNSRVVLQYFEQLMASKEQPDMTFVLALLMIRKRIMRLEGSEQDDQGNELMVVSCSKNEQEYKVPTTSPDADEIEEIQAQIVSMLYKDAA